MSGPSSPPPGWYHDGRALRWWDGRAWGPYAPPAALPPGPPRDPVRDGKTYAVLSHLGFLANVAGGIALPCVFRYSDTGKNPYVRHHATEALNFTLTMLPLLAIGWIIYVVSLVAAFSNGDGPSPAGVACLLVPVLVWGVFGVIGAVQAGKGRWWRYPVAIRFVGRGDPPSPAR